VLALARTARPDAHRSLIASHATADVGAGAAAAALLAPAVAAADGSLAAAPAVAAARRIEGFGCVPAAAHEQATALLRAMLAAKPQPIASGTSGAMLITLAGGATWPQLKSPHLFVRHFSDACAKEAMKGMAPGERFLVIRNTGSESNHARLVGRTAPQCFR